MTTSCIAHHELTIALTRHDRPSGLEHVGGVLAHPERSGAAILLAGEGLAGRIGRLGGDPGLQARFAAHVLTLTPGGRGSTTAVGPAVNEASGRATRRTKRPFARRRPPIGALWGWAQVTVGRDATETLVGGDALVLSPHPDDEAIGCGLLLSQKARGGNPVAVAVATDGRGGWYSAMPCPAPPEVAQVRHREWHRALDTLGVAEERRFELGFADGELADHEAEVADRISELLRTLRPSQVFVTKPADPHPDHRALARAACRAVTDVYRSTAPPQVYTYRVYPGEGLWPLGRPPRITFGATVVQMARSVAGLSARRPLLLRAPGSVSAKVAAVGAHESQRKLLDGELRYVWRTGVELYQPMEPSEHSGARSGPVPTRSWT